MTCPFTSPPCSCLHGDVHSSAYGRRIPEHRSPSDVLNSRTSICTVSECGLHRSTDSLSCTCTCIRSARCRRPALTVSRTSLLPPPLRRWARQWNIHNTTSDVWASPRTTFTLGARTFLPSHTSKREGGDHIAVPLFSYLRMATRRGSGTWYSCVSMMCTVRLVHSSYCNLYVDVTMRLLARMRHPLFTALLVVPKMLVVSMTSSSARRAARRRS